MCVEGADIGGHVCWGGGGEELCKRGGRDYLGTWFVGKKWGGGWVS